MTWNTPTDVSTGNALTALLWNNLLGTNGSLKYLYDYTENKSLLVGRNVSTSIAANSTYTISWDTLARNNGFTVSVPTTSITIPETGYYVYTWGHSFTVATQVHFRIMQTSPSSQLASNTIPSVIAPAWNSFAGIMYGTAGAQFTCPVAITTASTLNAFTGLMLVRISK